MSSESTPQTGQNLAALMENINTALNPEHEILKHLVAHVSEKDPELGEAIRYCAVPRRLTAEIIGALRQAPDDRETNERLMQKLLTFSFIRTRPDGGYTYHDGSREILLGEWKSPDRREKFDQLNQQLVGFYKDQYERTERLEQDLNSASEVMQRVNSARHVQITSVFQTRLIAPLLEALYHKSLQSAEAAYKYFERLYQDQETAGRLMVCESLLSGTRDCLERLPSDSDKEKWLKWLRYWKARFKRELRQDGVAVEILTDLLPETEADTTLKLWVLGDLGATYYQQSRLVKAGAAYQQVIELAKETGGDPYNLPVWYTRLAQLHWSLEELEEAEGKYREAIACAQEKNIGIEISARVDLSGVLYARGKWKEGLNNIIETLHYARTKLPSDKPVYRQVLGQLMSLLARRDPSLLDTIFLEARALLDVNDPLVPLRFSRQYVSLLQESGQLVRAEEQLTTLLENADKQKDQFLNIELQLERALLLEEQGRREEVVGLYEQLAKDATSHESGAWYCAAAISNRGINRAKLARWEQAESDLREGLTKWHDMGHDKLEAFIHGALATALRQQGRLEQAQVSLDQALSVLAPTQSPYLNNLYEEQWEIYQAQGRREDARVEYQKALDRYLSIDKFKQAARTLGSLTTLAGEQGDWEGAAQCTDEATTLWQRLAAINSYRPSPSAERGDKANAEGVQAFFATGEDRLKNAAKARDFFRTASQEVPGNFWYQLNLAYACAELEEWSEAAQAIARALEVSPEWLRTRMLYDRLAEYRAKQGEKIFGSGEYMEAAQFYTLSRKQLEEHVAFERLAEVELRLGDSLLKLGHVNSAQREYENGLSRSEAAGSQAFQAVFHARLGLLEALQSNLTRVLEHFRATISLRAQNGSTEVVEDLVTLTNEFPDLIKTVKDYRALGEALRVVADDLSVSLAQRQRLIDAQFNLSQSRYRATRSPSAEASRTTTTAEFPVAVPIVVEADARLFSADEATPEVDRMIQTDIPMMRQELILKNTGVTVPGVRIRANDNLFEGVYVLALDEIPITSGRVFAGEKFCPDSARCLELGIEGRPVINPDNGKAGMWLPEAAWKQAEDAGLELQDSYLFMILHLGSLLRGHLENFLGLQEVELMLGQWNAENEEEKRLLIKKAVPDDASLVRFTQVLQNLVKEEVPVRNLLAILTTFAEANSSHSELIEVTERVRMALRSDLPVNNGSLKLIGLSAGFESAVAPWIQQQDSKRFLAMPAEEVQKLVSALRDYLGGLAQDGLAIIVRTAELRPFIRRLLYLEYPSILVSSERELADGMTLPDERIELDGG